MMDKFIQGPKASQVSSKENPRARKVMEKNPIREDCLAKKGWPSVQSTSDIGNFLKKFNSMPGLADIRELFTLIHDGDGHVEKRQDLARQFAEAVLTADITFAETVEFLQQSRDWYSTETMEYRMNVIKVFKGEVIVNKMGFGRNSPLCLTARHGNAVAAKFLLSKGAEINHENDLWHTPLAAASIIGDVNVVKILLQDKSLILDCRGMDLRTPLSHAVQWAHVEVVGLLLKHGADPQIQGKMGRTSVSMAASCPKSEILELLLNHLPNPN